MAHRRWVTPSARVPECHGMPPGGSSVIHDMSSPPQPETNRVMTTERTIPAPPHQIFELLADPRRHPEFDGSGMLRGDVQGPNRLRLGGVFSMGMVQAGQSYRTSNRIIEFVENEVLTWETLGLWRGRKVIGGQRWRYALEEQEAGSTLVRHSYIWGTARFPLLTVALPRFPQKMDRAMPQTLERIEQLMTSSSPRAA